MRRHRPHRDGPRQRGNDPGAGFHGIAPKAKLTSIKVGASGGAVDVSQVIAGIDWVVQHRNDEKANPVRISAAVNNTASACNSRGTVRNLDLLAPGEQIVSLRDPGSYLDQTYPGARIGDKFFRGSGSSQAAAVAAGGIALLLQKRPTLTPDQVKALLKSTATALSGGVGELDLTAAVKAATPGTVHGAGTSAGVGSLESARGSNHVVHDNQQLVGEFDIFGGFNPAVWAQQTRNLTAWSGGVWMGRRMAGNGWTGTSSASKPGPRRPGPATAGPMRPGTTTPGRGTTGPAGPGPGTTGADATGAPAPGPPSAGSRSVRVWPGRPRRFLVVAFAGAALPWRP